MKKLCICFTAALLFLVGCSFSVPLISSAELLLEQKKFDTYTDRLFCEEVSGNTLNLHYTLAEPEKYAIKNPSISLGSYSLETHQQSISSLENMAAALKAFNYSALTTSQQLNYDILEDYCSSHLAAADFYYYNEPLRASTGIHAELPILLAEYAFYDNADVTNYLNLLSCIKTYFDEIIAFEQEKARQGLFMADFSADTVIATCLTFIENPNENYLLSTFDTRIDALDLPDEKKTFYKEKNTSLVFNTVIPAYQHLADAMEELKNSGANENDAGLCYFPRGKEYYASLVYASTGSSKSVKELQEAVSAQRKQDLSTLQKLYTNYPESIHQSDTPILDDDPIRILTHLQTAMLNDFSPPSSAAFSLHYIDASMEETLAPAFYLTAPMDKTEQNVIYINKSNGYSGIQLFTTLAHEGYPGHLYQTTASYAAGLSPIRNLLNYPGYTEGWATYVEMLSYFYAGLDEVNAQMQQLHQSALLSLYAQADLGIHADKWTLTDTLHFFQSYGINDRTAIQSIYELILAEPAHYLKYYIGYLEFLELKKNAQLTFGEKYSNRAFHDAILRIGPAPFSIIQKYLNDYYETLLSA